MRHQVVGLRITDDGGHEHRPEPNGGLAGRVRLPRCRITGPYEQPYDVLAVRIRAHLPDVHAGLSPERLGVVRASGEQRFSAMGGSIRNLASLATPDMETHLRRGGAQSAGVGTDTVDFSLGEVTSIGDMQLE